MLLKAQEFELVLEHGDKNKCKGDHQMNDLINSDSTAEQLAPFALAVFQIVDQFPVTMRSKNNVGVRVETGRVLSDEFTGPVLEKVLATNEVVREKSESGPYKGIPVVAAPIRDANGDCVAAIGVIDLRHAIA